MTPGGQVYYIAIVDSAGNAGRIGIEWWTDMPLCDGYLQRSETAVSYHRLKLAMMYAPSESLQTTLVGHTWGVTFHFTMYSNKKLDVADTTRPPLFLTVIPATGEEAEAAQFLADGKYRELLARFPHSRSVDEALRVLSERFGAEERMDLFREQARLNPRSPQLIDCIRGLKRNSGIKVYNDFLAELARDYPNAAVLEVLKPEKSTK